MLTFGDLHQERVPPFDDLPAANRKGEGMPARARRVEAAARLGQATRVVHQDLRTPRAPRRSPSARKKNQRSHGRAAKPPGRHDTLSPIFGNVLPSPGVICSVIDVPALTMPSVTPMQFEADMLASVTELLSGERERLPVFCAINFNV